MLICPAETYDIGDMIGDVSMLSIIGALLCLFDGFFSNR